MAPPPGELAAAQRLTERGFIYLSIIVFHSHGLHRIVCTLVSSRLAV